jgi:acetyltransferase-like isoleucine patch superfamily enzyme
MPSSRFSLTLLRPKHWPITLSKVPSTRRVRLLARLRFLSWWHRAPMDVHIPPGVIIGKRINIEVLPHSKTSFSIGKGSTIGDDVRLRLRGGKIEIGEGVDLRATSILNVTGGHLVIEGPSNVGWGVAIHCAESVKIGYFAQIAEYSTIVDSNHIHTAPGEWSYFNTRTSPIELGADVWVCPKSTITMGVTIGEHVIVGPSSVVTKDVPGGVLSSGIPAKVIRELQLPWETPELGDSETA